jgi:FkbM family methyltransferase
MMPLHADPAATIKAAAGRPRGFLWHSWRRLRKIVRLLPDRYFRLGLRHGVGAAIEHRAALATLRVASVLDVGANRGQFALLALSLFPDAHVHAFEPTPRPLQRLRAWAAGEKRLTLHTVALGATSGEVLMHLSLSDDNSSLNQPTDRQLTEYPATPMVDSMMVPLARLDEILSPTDLVRPCLLKIDVQGHEMDVLQGCGSLLDHIDHLLVECTYVELYRGQALAHTLTAHLTERGFVQTGVSHAAHGMDGTLLQADLLFSRPAP